MKSVATALFRRFRSTEFGAVAVLLVDNQLAKLRLARGNNENDVGSAYKKAEVDAALARLRGIEGAYRKWLGIERFHGRVVELGPGDSCGTGLLMLAHGAETVDLADRFYSTRDPTHHASIYRELIASTPGLDGLHGLSAEEQFKGIKRYYGPEAAAEEFFKTHTGYDFIVSCAVLEHLTDPIGALHLMKAALRPGGAMIHLVDLRDHKMFSDHGFHELKMLEFPTWLFREMTQAKGRPNRLPLSCYRMAIPDADILVGELVGVGQLADYLPLQEIPDHLISEAVAYVRKHRSKFAKPFRDEREEDLAVATFALAYRHPS